TASPLVEKVTGVDNVCERAALLGAETLLVKKQAGGGVTVAGVAVLAVGVSALLHAAGHLAAGAAEDGAEHAAKFLRVQNIKQTHCRSP
ncbi:MAG: cobalamin biosynthesis protein, partial [Desulfovibrio sp.]|nr:cobalamin biosynthesis protein [Desulfovibrio sp.]